MVLLKENGAEINHTDVKGKTPIFKARTYNTTKLLLNYGVSAYQDFYSLNLIIIYNLYLFICDVVGALKPRNPRETSPKV